MLDCRAMSDWEARLAARTGWAKLAPNARGAVWTLCAAFLFSLMALLVKLLGNRLDSFQIAFFRAAFGLLGILPFALMAGAACWQTRRLPLHFLRGSIGMLAMFCGFYALTHLPLADAVALSFTKPLFLIVLATILLGEKIRARRITATAAGFIGVLIMLRPGAEPDPAALVALGGALCVAFVVVTVKKLVQTERPVTVMFYFGLISTAIAAIPAALVWQQPTAGELAALIAIGLLGATAQSCMIRGYQVAEAMAVASLDYTRLIYAGLFSILIFHEVPDLWSVLGAAIIVCSTFYIVYRENQLGRRPTAPMVDQSPIKPDDIAAQARPAERPEKRAAD